MKNNIMAKTLLMSYNYLERIADKIDNIITKEALGSRCVTFEMLIHNSSMSVSNRIIELSERKVKIINLKVLIEEMLAKVSDDDFSLLCQRFIEGKKVNEIMSLSSCSERTAFRRIENAVDSFAKVLKSTGYNDYKLQDMISGEAWISNIAEKTLEKSINYEKAHQSIFSSNSK